MRPLPSKASAALGLLAGIAITLGQAPFSLWWLALLGIIWVFYIYQRVQSVKGAALLGWVVGAVFFAGSMYWITSPFQVDAARHGWMAPFALAFLAGGLALLWGAGFAWAKWAGGARAAGLMLALGWGGAEMLRGYLFTGFPWGLVGYMWIDTPVAQVSALTGPYGLTLLTFGVVGAAFGTMGMRVGAAVVAILVVTFGVSRNEVAPRVDAPIVRLVQTNATQKKKWSPEMVPIFWERNLSYTADRTNGTPDLIVWPETAVPYLANRAQGAFEVMANAADGVPVVAGIQRSDAQGFYNSLVVIDADGVQSQTYDKAHLVPFGEYVPGGAWAEKLGLQGLADQLGGGYRAGDQDDALYNLGAELGRVKPLICYEAVFPRDVHVAQDRADWILHITNDAWFGDLAGPQQHLVQARMRAIEQGLPVIRAANTGVSAIIDSRGEVVAFLELGTSGFLDGALPPAQESTFFSRSGNTPLILLFLTFILMLSVHRYRLSR